MPKAGGLYDQDALMVYGMTVVLEAQQELEERESKKKR